MLRFAFEFTPFDPTGAEPMDINYPNGDLPLILHLMHFIMHNVYEVPTLLLPITLHLNFLTPFSILVFHRMITVPASCPLQTVPLEQEVQLLDCCSIIGIR
jgi:hypothetical protein